MEKAALFPTASAAVGWTSKTKTRTKIADLEGRRRYAIQRRIQIWERR
jgi:hypothetical protein